MESAINTREMRKSPFTTKKQNRPIVDRTSKVYRASSTRTEESQSPKNKSQYQQCSKYRRYPVRPKRTEKGPGKSNMNSADSSQGKAKTETSQNPPEEKREKPVHVDAPPPAFNIWTVRIQMQKINEEKLRALEPKPQRTNRRYTPPSPKSPEPEQTGWEEVKPKKKIRTNSTPQADPSNKKEAEEKKSEEPKKSKGSKKKTDTKAAPKEDKEKPVFIDAPQPKINVWAVRIQKKEEERAEGWEEVKSRKEKRGLVINPSESWPCPTEAEDKKTEEPKRTQEKSKSSQKKTKTKAPPKEDKEKPVLIDAPQPKVNVWAVKIQKKEEERAEGWEEVKSRKEKKGLVINPLESWPCLSETQTKEPPRSEPAEPKTTQVTAKISQSKTKTQPPQEKAQEKPVLVNAPQPKVNIWAVRKHKMEEVRAENQEWEEVKPKNKIRTNSGPQDSSSKKKEAEDKTPEEPEKTKGSKKKTETKAPPKEKKEKPHYVDAAPPLFNAWTVRTQMQKMNVQASAISQSSTSNPEPIQTSAPLAQSQYQKKAVDRGPLRKEPAEPKRIQASAKNSQTKTKTKEKKENTYSVDAAPPSFNAWAVRTQVQKINVQKARAQANVQVSISNPEQNQTSASSAQKQKIDGHGLLCETCNSIFCICKAEVCANVKAPVKSQDIAPTQKSAPWSQRRERPKSQRTNERCASQSAEQTEAAGDGLSKITIEEPPVASGSTSNPESGETGGPASDQSEEECKPQKKQVKIIPGCEAWAKAKASQAPVTKITALVPQGETKTSPKNNGIGSSFSPKAQMGPASTQRWETVKYGRKKDTSQVNVIPGSKAWAQAKATQAPVAQRTASNPTNQQGPQRKDGDRSSSQPQNTEQAGRSNVSKVSVQQTTSKPALKHVQCPATSQQDLGARPKVQNQDEPRQQGKNKCQEKGFDRMKYELEADNELQVGRPSKTKIKTKPSKIPKQETPKPEFIPAPPPKVNAWALRQNLSPNSTQKISISHFPPLPITTTF